MFISYGSETANLFRHLAIMMNAGLSISTALAQLENQASTQYSRFLSIIRSRIDQGERLATACRGFPAIISTVDLNLIAAGERNGNVPAILGLICDNKMQWIQFRNRLISRLTYPIFLFHFSVAIIAVINCFILNSLSGCKTLVIGWGGFYVVIAILLMINRLWVYSPSMNRMIKRLISQFPVLYAFFPLQQIASVRFFRVFAHAIDAGLSMQEGVNIAINSSDLPPTIKDYKFFLKKLKPGTHLSKTLSDINFLTVSHIAIIETGENCGRLVESLNHVARRLEEEIETKLINLGIFIPNLIYVLILFGIIIKLFTIFPHGYLQQYLFLSKIFI